MDRVALGIVLFFLDIAYEEYAQKYTDEDYKKRPEHKKDDFGFSQWRDQNKGKFFDFYDYSFLRKEKTFSTQLMYFPKSGLMWGLFESCFCADFLYKGSHKINNSIEMALDKYDFIISFDFFIKNICRSDIDNILLEQLEKTCLNKGVKSDLYFTGGKDYKFRHPLYSDINIDYKDYEKKYFPDKNNKNIVSVILRKKGFPYRGNLQEYERFLDHNNKRIVFTSNNGYGYGILVSHILKALFGSPIKKKDFYRHTYIVGQSGSGKSEFLRTVFDYIGGRCILLDPHGDIAENLVHIDNVHIEPKAKRFVINPFDIVDKSPENRALVTEEIIQLLLEIIRDSGLSNTMETISYPIIYTLLALPYSDFKMFADCINPDSSGLERLKEISPYLDVNLHGGTWELLTSDYYDTTKRSVFTRLQSFLNKKLIMESVCGLDDLGSVLEGMENGDIKNLVVSLPIADIGESVAQVVGRFFMARMQIWAKRRKNIPEEKRTPYVLIVDECQNFLSEETARTLDQFGRKYGLFIHLAHQHIKQIESASLKGSILANCKNKIVGWSDKATRQAVAGEMGLTVDDFNDLNAGHFFGKFDKSEPFRFYAKRAKNQRGKKRFAHSQNGAYVNGWDIIEGELLDARKDVQNARTANKPTTTAKPKFDL